MKVGSREHYDIVKSFEDYYRKFGRYGRSLDKADKDEWYKGNVFNNGEVNELFHAYQAGYSNGRITYLHGDSYPENYKEPSQAKSLVHKLHKIRTKGNINPTRLSGTQ